MLGIVTPGGFLPIGHHIVSLIMSYFTLRLRPQKAIRAPWLAYGWIILAQIGPAAKHARCISLCFKTLPSQSSKILNEQLTRTE